MPLNKFPFNYTYLTKKYIFSKKTYVINLSIKNDIN
jgi:hypothetical protein